MQSYNSYNIDFTKLAAWLTPKAFRKPIIGIIFSACLFALNFIHGLFVKYRKAKLYQLQITSQVCYLERMLNDRFDYTLRRIRIDDAAWHLPWFLFQEDELKPQAFFQEAEAKPVPLFNDSEAGNVKADFVVLVPISISFSEPEMRSLVDSYKLFGTTYSIQKT